MKLKTNLKIIIDTIAPGSSPFIFKEPGHFQRSEIARNHFHCSAGQFKIYPYIYQKAFLVSNVHKMSSSAMQGHLKTFGYKIQSISPDSAEKYDSSIPLILPNDHEYDLKTKSIIKKADVQRTSLYLVPEAIELLSSITSPLAILSICGPMRTGKSYILSR
jgi:hypothetical protein